MAVAESIHELFEIRGSLDLEKDLTVVVCDLDVEVLGRGFSCSVWGVAVVGHLAVARVEQGGWISLAERISRRYAKADGCVLKSGKMELKRSRGGR